MCYILSLYNYYKFYDITKSSFKNSFPVGGTSGLTDKQMAADIFMVYFYPPST